VFNLVTGLGRGRGRPAGAPPDVDKVASPDRPKVGKIINRAATDTLKRVTLELGGKSPVIVLPDVDISKTAAGAARSIFANSGQVCIAGSRLYAHRDIFDRLLEGVAEAATRFKMGPSLAPDTMMGPLVSDEQRTRVMSYIEQGRKAGASVFHGGEAPGGSGYFVEPTILVDVKPDMSVVREEIFGPVLAAQRFDDLDEVARRRTTRPMAWPRPFGPATSRPCTRWRPSCAPAWCGATPTRPQTPRCPSAASSSPASAARAGATGSRPIRSSRRSRSRSDHPRHCEERSDEAIQSAFAAALDCFASLAMTEREGQPPPAVRLTWVGSK
jgi:hypothetical protein